MMEEKNTSINNENGSKKEIEQFINRGYEEIDFYSSQLSKILRQLAFAEGALFWFCKEKFNSSTFLIGVGFAFLLFYFLFDAKQYLSGLLHFKKQTAKFYDDFVIKKFIILRII